MPLKQHKIFADYFAGILAPPASYCRLEGKRPPGVTGEPAEAS
jgi:hypothetical protein